jgi:hypothetical protein
VKKRRFKVAQSCGDKKQGPAVPGHAVQRWPLERIAGQARPGWCRYRSRSATRRLRSLFDAETLASGQVLAPDTAGGCLWIGGEELSDLVWSESTVYSLAEPLLGGEVDRKPVDLTIGRPFSITRLVCSGSRLVRDQVAHLGRQGPAGRRVHP